MINIKSKQNHVTAEQTSNGVRKISLICLIVALIFPAVPLIVFAQSSGTNPNAVYDYSIYTGAPLTASSFVNPNALGPSLSACQSLNGFQSVANCALGIINLIIPIIVAITVVWTIYSSFELARTEGDDRKKWGWAIFYGLLGIFLMISVYGLVAIFTGTFGFSGSSVTVPNLNNTVQLSQ